MEAHAGEAKRAKALTSAASPCEPDRPIWQPGVAEPRPDQSGDPRADRPIGVGHAAGDLQRPLLLTDVREAGRIDLVRCRHVRIAPLRASWRFARRTDEQRCTGEAIGAIETRSEPIRAPDEVVESAQPEPREDHPHFVGEQLARST